MESLPEYKIPSIERLRADHNDAGADFYTQAMFHQFNWKNKHRDVQVQPTFTLRDYDHDGCYSFYLLFMAHNDDYSAALAILGSWAHFEALCKASWFREKLEKWREEREIREKSIAKATLIAEARNGNVSAAKAINEIYARKGAGRPSKEEVDKEKRKAAAVDGKVAQLLDRMEQRHTG